MSEKKPITAANLIKKLSKCEPNTPIRTLHYNHGWCDEYVDVVDIDNHGDVCYLMLSEYPYDPDEEENDYF